MIDFRETIKTELAKQQKNIRQIAIECDLPYATVNQYLKGLHDARSEVVAQLLNALGCELTTPDDW